MKDNPYILLVEAESDKSFFEKLLKQNYFLEKGVTPDIKIIEPTEQVDKNDKSAKQGGKGNAIDKLPTMIKLLESQKLLKIALIIDADSIKSGGGVKNTIKQISEKIDGKTGEKIKSQGYTYFENINKKTHEGFIFRDATARKLPDINVWIMPNNADEGYLEYFIKSNLKSEEEILLKYAEACIENLPKPTKFKDVRRQKAELATYLAFQETPGTNLAGVIGAGLIDLTQGTVKNLMDWLIHTFPKIESL